MTASHRRVLAWSLLLVALAAVIYNVQVYKGMADFAVYRTAAGRAITGDNLYRPEDGHYQYKYFPAFALAAAPFAMADDRVARIAWYALSFALMCAFVRLSVRNVPDRRLSERALLWCAVILIGKYYARELYLGQTNFLFGTILIGALISARAGRRGLTGALVGLAVFVKPYALILVPWLWLVAGLPGVVAHGVVLAAGFLIPAFVYGWDGNLDQLRGWYRTVTDTSAPNLLKEENISFATTWAKWIGPGPAAARLALATSAAALGTVVFMLTRRRSVREPAFLEFGALMLLVPLMSPQGWDYLLLLATPAILVVADRWRDTSLPWRVVTGFAIGGLSFTIFDLLGRTLYAFAMQISFVSVCAVILIACLVNLRLRKLA